MLLQLISCILWKKDQCVRVAVVYSQNAARQVLIGPTVPCWKTYEKRDGKSQCVARRLACRMICGDFYDFYEKNRREREMLVSDARCGFAWWSEKIDFMYVMVKRALPAQGGYVLNLEGYFVKFDRLFSPSSFYRGKQGRGAQMIISIRAHVIIRPL